MTTNYQWLLEMDGAERKAWFDAEHVETPNATLHGDTAALDDKIAELTADNKVMATELANFDKYVFQLRAERDELRCQIAELTAQLEEHREGWNSAIDGWQKASKQLEESREECEHYRNKFSKCLEYADAIHALMDEGLA